MAAMRTSRREDDGDDPQSRTADVCEPPQRGL